MNMKNVIKRIGVIFILGPVLLISFIAHLIMWISVPIWGSIYYIITGKDPVSESNETLFLDMGTSFADWYLKRFAPDEYC